MSTPDQVYKTTINTSAEKLWAAITNPEFTQQYWFGNANIATEWKKGAKWEHRGMDSGTLHHVGEVLECEPYSKLVLSWHMVGETKDISRVTFEIVEQGDHVQLTIIHGDFVDGSTMAASVSKGWPNVIANMKEFLEEGCATHKSGCAA